MKKNYKNKIAILLAIYESMVLKTMADNKILKYFTAATLGLSTISASICILNCNKPENNNNNFKQNKFKNLENKNIYILNSDKTNDKTKSSIKNLEQNNKFKNKIDFFQS